MKTMYQRATARTKRAKKAKYDGYIKKTKTNIREEGANIIYNRGEYYINFPCDNFFDNVT